MKKIGITVLFFCLTILSLSAQVWTIQTVPNTKLQDAHSYLSNPDGLVDAQSEAGINQILAGVEQSTTSEVFVVALKSVGEIPYKQFATELFNEWGIGKAGNDNGLLILMVEDQRHVTFETGYGLEGILPDAICKRIIENSIVPSMREGKYGNGLLAGVNMVAQVLSDPKVAEEIRADMEAEALAKKNAELAAFRTKMYTFLFVYLLLSFVVLGFSIQNVFKKIKGTEHEDPYAKFKMLSTSKMGFRVLTFLFPLTMVFFFLWFNKKMKGYRSQPRLCPVCGKSLNLMTEQQEDLYLNSGQQQEEAVGSIDYDAWVCLDCGHRSFLPYNKTFTNYTNCPKCGFKTYSQIADKIALAPTPFSCGEGVKIYGCAHCHHEIRKSYTIPMIVVIPTGRGGDRGGFGGGGFGGGGSFGGGSSGGGGASGGW